MTGRFPIAALLVAAVLSIGGFAPQKPAAQQKPAAPQKPAPKPEEARITLHATDTDIGTFLRLISKVSGVGTVIAPDVRGRVNAVLNDVPWSKALDAVLEVNGLVARREGNIIRVMMLADARRRRAAGMEAAGAPVEVCTYRLDNARADEVANMVRPFLSARGRIVADPRTNTLIVSDAPAVLENLGFSPVARGKGSCVVRRPE